MATVVWTVHMGSTLALTGLIWLVQVVQYPLFAEVGAEAFPRYHAAHTRTITFVVLPLMGAELVTGLALALRPPPSVAPPWLWLGLALVGVVWMSTAGVQVPRHAALADGFDPAVHRALVRGNWLRTAAWTARAVLLLFLTGRLLVEPLAHGAPAAG